MADYAPVYSAGQTPFTMTTSASVTGGTLAAVSGSNTVATAGALSAIVLGVFAHDAPSGGRVSIWPLDGLIHEIVAANNITQGNGLQAAANGQVDPAGTSLATQAAAGTLIGTALQTVTANTTNKVRFQGRR
ncbi:capsid cement protein [Dactylosporangium sp. CA-052675]|uniref:capsid cement protein n=1 Tax=Dactylosporangium sp. CA-052675 TaxID=3239927 RepID=UPI003D93CAD3